MYRNTHAFITPCSMGDTLGSCPYSNYLIEGVKSFLVKELPQGEPQHNDCPSCPLYKTKDEIEKLEEIIEV